MPRPDIEQMEGRNALRRELQKAPYLINIDVILQAIIAKGGPSFCLRTGCSCSSKVRTIHAVIFPSAGAVVIFLV